MSGTTTNATVNEIFFFAYAKHLRAMRNKKKPARFQKRLDEAKIRVARDATAAQELHDD